MFSFLPERDSLKCPMANNVKIQAGKTQGAEANDEKDQQKAG